jgi:hypothetical protein
MKSMTQNRLVSPPVQTTARLHCGELLTVPVDDPMGEESYPCGKCGGEFDADWGEEVVRNLNQE